MPPLARRKRILLGVTGSVATVKVPEIIVALIHQGCDVWTLLTRGAEQFWAQAATYNPSSWQELQELIQENSQNDTIRIIYTHEEWREWKTLGDPVMHIELRQWADVAVVAPLSAHTLAKLAHGLCDDVLTSALRAWDYRKPLILAPAMNTYMWEHPLTSQQLSVVASFGCVQVVRPVVKELACGDVGRGALAPVGDLVAAIMDAPGEGSE